MYNKETGINIEYAHLYATNVLSEQESIKKNIERTLQIITVLSGMDINYSLNILVDDYSNGVEKVNIPEVIKYFSLLGLEPDHIILESSLVSVADHFISFLPDRFLNHADDKLIFSSESSDIHFKDLLKDNRSYKIVFMEKIKAKRSSDINQGKQYLSLKQQRCHSNSDLILVHKSGNESRYGCPLLAACWYLARLGIEPFYSAIQSQLTSDKPFIGKTLITVLPIDYLKVESTALELIGLSKTKTIKKAQKKMEYYFVS